MPCYGYLLLGLFTCSSVRRMLKEEEEREGEEKSRKVVLNIYQGSSRLALSQP